MTRARPSTTREDRIRHIDVFLGAAPLLEVRLVEGLLAFGRSHPNWRFSLRSAEFRYTPGWFRRHPLDGVLILIDGTHVAHALKAAGRPFVKLVPAKVDASGCVGVDDAAIVAYFKGVCEAASGCLFEIAQREVGTIHGDFERGRQYVRLAREAVDAYWRP